MPTDQVSALAAAIPELALRTEPAHREAFVELGPGNQISPAQWQLASTSLHEWAHKHRATPSELGARITYLASGPVTPTSAPDCDFDGCAG